MVIFRVVVVCGRYFLGVMGGGVFILGDGV